MLITLAAPEFILALALVNLHDARRNVKKVEEWKESDSGIKEESKNRIEDLERAPNGNVTKAVRERNIDTSQNLDSEAVQPSNGPRVSFTSSTSDFPGVNHITPGAVEVSVTENWTLSHAFFADMGGFFIDFSLVPEGTETITLDSETAQELEARTEFEGVTSIPADVQAKLDDISNDSDYDLSELRSKFGSRQRMGDVVWKASPKNQSLVEKAFTKV